MKLWRLLFLFLVGTSTLAFAQSNPVPFVNQPLVPMTVAPGGPGFTLTVNGSGFVSGSTVNWDGSALTTTFVSSMQLTAAVPAGDIATAKSAGVTVTNPAPGGGVSGAIYLGVTNPVASLTFTNYSESFYFGGTFMTPALLPPIAADFNGDGKLDLAFIAYVTISDSSSTFQACIELGNGDGSFQPPNCTAVTPPGAGQSESPHWLVAADFNGDGNLDLALSNGYDGTNTISIFLGNGDGTLRVPHSFPAGPPVPLSLSVADFNGDGKLDLAVLNQETTTSGDISILLGNGDGTFQEPLEYALPFTPEPLVVGDFNRDGTLDLAFANTNPAVVYVGLGNGDGTFQTPQEVANLIEYPSGNIATADFNGDGKLDLVLPTINSSGTVADIVVMLGNGDATFQPPVTYPIPYVAYGYPVVADVNADGKPDLLVAPWNEDSNSVNITLMSAMIGNGDGTFQNPVNLPTPALPVGGTGGPVGLLAGDFNGDGQTDMLLPYDNCYPCVPPAGSSFFFFVQGSYPAAGVSPAVVAFPQQAVGSTSTPQSVTLTNIGGVTLTISGIDLGGQDASDFAETNDCGPSLAVAASCQIKVSFTPTAFGNRNGAVIIANDGLGGSQAVILTGTTPPGAAVSFSPPNIVFPSQYLGTSGLPQTVTLTNTGTATLTISKVGTSKADFGSVNACGSSVAVGASCAIAVFFDPTTSGTRAGTLAVTDNANDSPQSVSLSGTGQDFSSAASSSSTASVSPGQTASYAVIVTPEGGFNQTVLLACSGAPLQSTCTVSPSSITLDGVHAAPANVAVVTARSSATLNSSLRGSSTKLAAVFAMLGGVLGFLGMPRRVTAQRKHRAQFLGGLFVLCLVSVVLIMPACGGGSGGGTSGGGGTPTGTYNVTVTGTFSSGSAKLTHNTSFTLVVQ